MIKHILLLALLVAISSTTSEDKSLKREKRQGFQIPGFNLNFGQGGQGAQGNLGGLGFNIANPFARPQQPQTQSFNQQRPQTFPIGGFNQGGFNQAGNQGQGGFNPGQGGFNQGGQQQGGISINQNINCRDRRFRNHPSCKGQQQGGGGNQQINCNRRRNRNRPECQNQGRPQPSTQGGPDTAVTSAFAQIPWLNQLSRDGQNLLIPNLPKTPAAGANTRFFQLGNGLPDLPFQECVTPNFEAGNCRYLQYCILPDFANSFNRFLQYVCFVEGRYVGVCCPKTANNNGVTQSTPAPTTPAPTPRPTTAPSQSRGCGLIAKRPPTRIVGGRPADPREWPWMAALIRNENQYCGGTLVTDRHILTAAHCIDGFDRNTIKVRLGEYTFDRTDDSAHVDFEVSEIRMHEAYDRNTYVNDIAILVLAQTTSFNDAIWPVCLPEGDDSYVDKVATVTGWGTIYFGGPVASTLQEVTVPIWTNADCDAAYEQTIIDKQLCAGDRSGGKDSCQGDSGGPLLLQQGSENRWSVIGVVSWGIRCAEKENPGVYTRVTKYRDWIRNNAR